MWKAIGLVSVAVVWGDLAVVSAAVEGTHTHKNRHGSPGHGGDRRQMSWLWFASAINSGRNCFVGAAGAIDFYGQDTLRSVRGGCFGSFSRFTPRGEESGEVTRPLCSNTTKRGQREAVSAAASRRIERCEDTKVTTEVKDLTSEMPACSCFGGSR